MRRRGATAAARLMLGAALILAQAATAQAQSPSGWKPARMVDAVTDAVREGAIYRDGDDRLLVACTTQKSGRKRFWIELQTDAHLGRDGSRSLTYRVGDEAATTSAWDYTPRSAAPGWPLEDRHIVQRVLEHQAARIVFRMDIKSGGPHDLTVPIDAGARELMTKTLAAC